MSFNHHSLLLTLTDAYAFLATLGCEAKPCSFCSVNESFQNFLYLGGASAEYDSMSGAIVLIGTIDITGVLEGSGDNHSTTVYPNFSNLAFFRALVGNLYQETVFPSQNL